MKVGDWIRVKKTGSFGQVVLLFGSPVYRELYADMIPGAEAGYEYITMFDHDLGEVKLRALNLYKINEIVLDDPPFLKADRKALESIRRRVSYLRKKGSRGKEVTYDFILRLQRDVFQHMGAMTSSYLDATLDKDGTLCPGWKSLHWETMKSLQDKG